jgi:intracellular sulfur oxidation DsrE/DsrF family protein
MRLARIFSVCLLIGSLSLPAAAADLRIDIPVALKEAKIVLNMDHLVFEGTTPTGLNYMTRLSANLVENHAKWQMTAIFHGPAGYMLLDDAAYDRVKQSTAGNPYKQMIAQLQKAGVRFEECGQTARANGWVNADLLPDVAVNSGAEPRIVQLVQDGFVQLQP